MPGIEAETTEPQCPDCGCFVRDHNAVNRAGNRLIAHCGTCGACWNSDGTPFVEQVRESIRKENQ